ncbi:hypothetical protein CP556_20340 [Natrinema sp. CBA1119]|nr:hypothetical protein CP556_20340 [Natrinema sp. CBA1119]
MGLIQVLEAQLLYLMLLVWVLMKMYGQQLEPPMCRPWLCQMMVITMPNSGQGALMVEVLLQKFILIGDQMEEVSHQRVTFHYSANSLLMGLRELSGGLTNTHGPGTQLAGR